MAMASVDAFFFSFSLFFHFLSLSHSATITLQNNCTHTIWPGILSGAGTAPLSTTGFSLLPTAASVLSVPPSWSGRIWARTYCSTDPSSGRFSCATADCGSGAVACGGACAAPPATLAEFTLNGGGGFDFYDVSLVDGYNIAMQIVPVGGKGGKSGNCTATGCIADLNGDCPPELQVARGGGEDGGSGAWRVKARVWRLGKQNIAAVGRLQIRTRASPVITPSFSRTIARWLTVTPSMTEPALSPVCQPIMSLPFALLPLYPGITAIPSTTTLTTLICYFTHLQIICYH